MITDSMGRLKMVANSIDMVKDVVKTVKTSGGDFTTIQDAIDWFAERIPVSGCRIDVDAGTWTDSAGILDVTGLMCLAPGALTIRGDTRELGGLTYVDGAAGNPMSLTNGGSGAVSLTYSGYTVTVTCATTNPDFDADGWGSGDKVLIYTNAAAIGEYTIDSVANNVITLTATAPAIGDDGTSIVLLPNRRVQRTTAGNVWKFLGTQGLAVEGFYLYHSGTGASCNGIYTDRNAGELTLGNIVLRVEDYGIIAQTRSFVYASPSPLSAWGCSIGIYVAYSGVMIAPGFASVGCGHGAYVNMFGYFYGVYGAMARCSSYGAQIMNNSTAWFYEAYVRNNGSGVGLDSRGNSMCFADGTNGQINASTNYNPAPGGTGQYAESASNFGIMYYS